MKIFALVLLPLLVGCGQPQEQADDNHGYGWRYDLTAADGTRLRNDPPSRVLDQADMEDFIAKPYGEVEKCVEILTGGPLVVMIPTGSTEVRGITYLHSGTIVMHDDSALDGWFTVPLPDGTLGPYSALRHEYVHYLLHASGFPDDLNAAHKSPLFMQCAGI